MKVARRAFIMVVMLSLAAVLALSGCGVLTTGPKTWTSGRTESKLAKKEAATVIEDYTLHEGTASEFTVANYFGNDMIVPRDRRIEIWGTAPESENGKIVAAEFKGLKGSGEIKDGAFCFALQGTLPASKEKGQTLIVKGAAGVQKEYTDVLVGDVWIVSGQSNADLTFWGTLLQTTKDIKALYDDYLKEATEEDDIRILQQINWTLLNKAGIERMSEPQNDIGKQSKWQLATKRKVYSTGAQTSFSMLGYFFAKELYKLNPSVPIGIVMAACGGSPLDLLCSPEAYEKFPEQIKNRTITLNDIELPYCAIYNAFIAPLRHVGVTGMIFYQGESDAMLSAYYADALKTTVEDYRKQFGTNMLFLNVQLTTYGFESGGETLNGVWEAVPEMRFAQAELKLDGSLPLYEIIPTIDVGFRKGDGDGAHPYYKFEIGERAAKMAAAIRYGQSDLESVGSPVPKEITYTKDKITIEYQYVGGGLRSSDDRINPQGFEALINGMWQIVFPTIEGESTVVIEAENAEGVRYAPNLRYFNMNAATLVSGTGNIAVPFSVEFAQQDG